MQYIYTWLEAEEEEEEQEEQAEEEEEQEEQEEQEQEQREEENLFLTRLCVMCRNYIWQLEKIIPK